MAGGRKKMGIGIGTVAVLLAGLVFFLFLTRNYKKEYFEKKEYFYSSACFLLEKCYFFKFFSDRQKKRLKDISIGEDLSIVILKYQCQRISYGIYGGFLVLVLALLFLISSLVGQSEIGDRRVMRPLYGEGKKEVSRDITLQPKKGKESIRQTLDVQIQEKQYTKKEWDLILPKVEDYLSKAVLGENISQQEVRKPLKFIEQYPRTSIKIRWKTDENIVKADGTLKNTWKEEDFPKDGILTEITAVISSASFRAEYIMNIKVLPEIYTGAESAWQELQKLVMRKEETTRTKDFFEIPEKAGDYQVVINKEKNAVVLAIILGMALIAFLTMIPAEKIKEEEKRREKQLMADYSKVINQFVLLIGAGLTIRGVFERLVREYGKNKKKGAEKRYVYEEMAIAVRAMENGASEIDAMEAFGKRTRQLAYLKFISLLIQNSKKGSGDLLLLLENEAALAMEQRKERIRVMGEEAGTKLLLPMLIMLCIVFSVIMVPAFMSF